MDLSAVSNNPVEQVREALRRFQEGCTRRDLAALGETFIWPLRFTAVLVRRKGRWLFHQMQFSFPTTRYPDERLEV